MGALKQAEIIPISKGKGNMTDKFEEGHVRSSWQYRRDVYPFLSDAARHVYFMLGAILTGLIKNLTMLATHSFRKRSVTKTIPKLENQAQKPLVKGLRN